MLVSGWKAIRIGISNGEALGRDQSINDKENTELLGVYIFSAFGKTICKFVSSDKD